MRGDEIDLRKFDPSMYGYRPGATPEEVLESNPYCCPLVHVNIDVNLMNFALFADGACWGNGTLEARASVGVYGTPNAWYNEAYVLPPSVPQTNQNAEIHAAIAALDVASAILKVRWDDQGCVEPIMTPGGRRHVHSVVVVVMDSKYVVDAMTDWIRRWRANGFRSASGTPVVNTESMKALDDKVSRLFHDHLVNVCFWHVPREYNRDADRLAAEALRSDHRKNLHLDSDLDELADRLRQLWW